MTPARHAIHGFIVAAVLLVMLAACANRPHAHTVAPAAPPVTATMTHTPIVSSPAETCQALTDMDVLESAEGFVLIGGVVQPGDVIPIVISLQSVQRLAETVFQTALGNIIDALQNLDTAVTDGTGETVDTSTVQPDANLLAGMCRARGLAVPTVL